jgi:hypothetical protein
VEQLSQSKSALSSRRVFKLGWLLMSSVITLLITVSSSLAQGGYRIHWWTVDNGGGMSRSSNYTLIGTAGQPDAGGAMTGGGYTLAGGFWAGVISTPVAPAANLVQNPSFEEAKNHWHFFTNGQGRFTTAAPASDGDRAARVEISQSGSNVQLYQKNIALEPNTPYELRFDATSNSGHNLRVFMHKHGAPYTNYGLKGAWVNLESGYQTFTISFTTTNFASPVTDARLRFWLAPYAQPGDVYRFDNVRLVKLDAAAASLARESAYLAGEVVIEEDEAGLVVGGPVPEDDATATTQHLYLPLVTR